MSPDEPQDGFVLPGHESLVARFAFVDNEALREELSLVLEYVTFLTQLEKTLGSRPTIAFSVRKDIVLWTACIVEATLHHALCVLQKRGTQEEKRKLVGLHPEYKEMKKCWQLPAQEDGYEQNIVCGIQCLVPQSLKGMLFQELIERAGGIGLFDAEIKRKATYLRKRRNELHLQALDTKSVYEKTTITKVFEDAGIILKCLEERLASIV